MCDDLHISPKLLYLTTSHYRPWLSSACRWAWQCQSFTPPLWPHLNFDEILHPDSAAIDMKHIKRDFSLKAWVRVRWLDLGGGIEAKINFPNMVMLHIKLNAIEHRSPWKQICCHYTHQRPLGWGQKLFSFLKVVMLHIESKWKKCWPTYKVTLWIYTHPWPQALGFKVRYWNCADVNTCILFFIKLSTKTYLTGVCYDLNDTEGELRVKWDLCFVIYRFLSNNPSLGDINSSNLCCSYKRQLKHYFDMYRV